MDTPERELDRPRLIDAVVPVPLPDGRVAIRNSARGYAVLFLDDPAGAVAACLRLLDGSRTVAQVRAALARERPGPGADDVPRLLAALEAAEVLEEGRPPESLRPDRALRHSRNLSCFGDRAAPRGSKFDIQECLCRSRVLILGLGGLGSTCALGLAMLGVGSLVLVDFDRVEVQNLNRQVLYDTASIGRLKPEVAVERLRAVDPELEYLPVTRRITSADDVEALLREHEPELTVLAADRPVRAIDRWTSAGCWRTRRPYITGTVNGRFGAVWARVPGVTGCEECALLWLRDTAPDKYAIALARERGDLMPLTSALGVGVQVVAGLIGNDVYHHLTGEPMRSAGQRMIVDFTRLTIEASPEPAHPDCACRAAREVAR